MGILNIFRRGPEAAPRAEATDAGGLSFTGPDDPRMLEYIRAGVVDGYRLDDLRNTAVLRCVSLICESIGMLPLNLLKNDSSKAPAADHPVYRLLKYRPNGWQTPYEFKTGMQLQALLYGNAYARVVMSRGQPIALVPINSTQVDAQLDRDTLTMRYELTMPNGAAVQLPPGQVLHLRDLSVNHVRGMSRMQLARHAIEFARDVDDASANMFRTGVMSGGAVEVGKALSDGAYKRMTESLQHNYSGSVNARKWMLLEEGAKANQFTQSAADAQLMEQRNQIVQDIARVFGVPRPLLMMDETSWGCLPGDTKVFTTHGPVAIKDVREGDELWSFNGEAMERQRVECKQMTGIKPVLHIKTRTYTLRCTGNHRVVVRRKFPTPRAGVGGYRAVEWRNVWVDASEIVSGDYLLTPLGFDGDRMLSPSGRKLTPGFMEVCGLYVAEGSMHKSTVCLARHSKAPYMDAYRASAVESFESRDQTDYARTAPVRLQECERMTRFTSAASVRELRELGFDGVAHTKRVPGWVFECTRELRLAFLRGYLDGDGSVNTRGWIAWSSCNRELIEDVRHLCIGVGVPCGAVREYQTQGVVEINGRTTHRGTMYQAWCYVPELNADIGSHDPRYIERWNACAKTARVGNWSPDYVGRGPAGSRVGEGFAIPDVRLHRVLSVESPRVAEPVYDLQVSGAHTYVADGVVVHNSGIEQLGIFFVQYGLQHWFTLWEQAVERTLLADSELGQLVARFNDRALLRGTINDQAGYLSKALGSGGQAPWMTQNEVRDTLDMPESDDPVANQLRNPMTQKGQTNEPAQTPRNPR